MRRREKKKKGFTLIEIMAALLVFGVVSSAIMGMISTVNQYNAENKNQFDTSGMSRAFNEGIKNIRPVDNIRSDAGAATQEKGYPDLWKENPPVAGNPTDGGLFEYYIAFNTIDGLNKAIKESFLKDVPKTNNVSNGYWFDDISSTQTIEGLATLPEVKDYKYIIRIRVQNKAKEKVYLFDTETMDVKNGITTITERKFAISSIA